MRAWRSRILLTQMRIRFCKIRVHTISWSRLQDFSEIWVRRGTTCRSRVIVRSDYLHLSRQNSHQDARCKIKWNIPSFPCWSSKWRTKDNMRTRKICGCARLWIAWGVLRLFPLIRSTMGSIRCFSNRSMMGCSWSKNKQRGISPMS